MKSATDNIFGETAMNNSKVKFGAPHIVDFGQELQYSPDGKVVSFFFEPHPRRSRLTLSPPCLTRRCRTCHPTSPQLYIIGHGAVRPEAHQSWMQGDQVYLARAEPDPATINDGNKWEFFAGHDASGNALWATGDVSKAEPLFTWNNHTGGTP